MADEQFILASASPRRRDLLNQLGLSFTVVAVDIDETPDHGEIPDNYVRRMATNKALAGWECADQLPVLAADTICVLDQQILGKPESLQAAEAMLGKLSGSKHTVITAVSLYNEQHQQIISKSQVSFKPLSMIEIQNYCQTHEPMGKAGSYAIQGYAAAFISNISGSYSNIVGLPLFETAELLKQIDIHIFPAKLHQ
ncbi:MAG: Maf family protein [Methylococcales bacterium]